MLTIIPTPIGNLKDITLRALEALKQADVIACEDTRQTRKLVDAYDIKTPLTSYHDHSGQGRIRQLVDRLGKGERVALVSDGGTPLVSDPGFKLVQEARKAGFEPEVLPGATAVTTALVASGLAIDAFSFHGFLPQKGAARRKLIEDLADREETLVFYESPFRLLKTLEAAGEVLGDREAAVARELTKKFEETVRGTLPDLVEHFRKKSPRGEMVLLISGKNRKRVLKDG